MAKINKRKKKNASIAPHLQYRNTQRKRIKKTLSQSESLKQAQANKLAMAQKLTLIDENETLSIKPVRKKAIFKEEHTSDNVNEQNNENLQDDELLLIDKLSDDEEFANEEINDINLLLGAQQTIQNSDIDANTFIEENEQEKETNKKANKIKTLKAPVIKFKPNSKKTSISKYEKNVLKFEKKQIRKEKKYKKKQQKLQKRKENRARNRIGCFGVFVIFSFFMIVGSVYTVYDLIGKSLLFENVEVELPNFIGMNILDVQDDSEYAMFNFKIENVFEEGLSTGTILSQFPVAPRNVKEHSTVTLRVNTPPQPVQIPDIEKMQRSEVKDELQLFELSAFFKTIEDSTVPHNTVMYTEPAIGSTVLQGSTVTVYISRDPTLSGVVVPDVTGVSFDSAVSALRNAGLTYNSPSANPSGTVLAQSPAPGAYVASGAAITLTFQIVVKEVPLTFVHSPGDGDLHDFVLVQVHPGADGVMRYGLYTCSLCGMQTFGEFIE